METTKNDLPKNVKRFFYELSEYLDTKLFYYGSIQRSDYVAGKSDIDIDIFTDNEYSMMNKMQHFLHVQKNDFKKVVWIIKGTTTYGYKIPNTDKNPQTNLYQQNFDGTSNVYAPYIYHNMEAFTPSNLYNETLL